MMTGQAIMSHVSVYASDSTFFEVTNAPTSIKNRACAWGASCQVISGTVPEAASASATPESTVTKG
jgi:hypothetical protein